jgi:hypothetical protein
VARGSHQRTRHEQQCDSRENDRTSPEAIGEPANDRREGKHAGDVKAENHAHDAQRVCRVVPGAADVHRCHRHDTDHHQVAHRHGAHPQASRRMGSDVSQRGAHSVMLLVSVATRGRRSGAARQNRRIGPHQEHEKERGEPEQQRGEGVRSGQCRHTVPVE